MAEKKIKTVAVIGPTASGKTGLACGIASRIDCEIIGADSMQIYKGFPIASAAPTAEEKGDIPHHLIEILEPTERFSVADYIRLAGDRIRDINARGRLPLLVGGTGLYIDSLLSGMVFTEEEGNEDVRERLEAEFSRVGGAEMLARLAATDPKTAARLHENDRKRIIRALEIYELHGITADEMNARTVSEPSPYEALKIGITYRDRETLYRRIDERVGLMLERGLIEEARAARSALGTTAVQAIGHKELYPYLDGEISLDEAAENLKRATRRYAKRQLTWFRRDPSVKWIYADEETEPTAAFEMINEFLD